MEKFYYAWNNKIFQIYNYHLPVFRSDHLTDIQEILLLHVVTYSPGKIKDKFSLKIHHASRHIFDTNYSTICIQIAEKNAKEKIPEVLQKHISKNNSKRNSKKIFTNICENISKNHSKNNSKKNYKSGIYTCLYTMQLKNTIKHLLYITCKLIISIYTQRTQT